MSNNAMNDSIRVNFFSLQRYQPHPGEVTHKSNCPVCNDGLLLMCRDISSGQLLADDYCVLCGQRFIYDDIERIREELP